METVDDTHERPTFMYPGCYFHDMTLLILSSQAVDVPNVVSLVIVIMALVTVMTVVTASVLYVYGRSFGLPGMDADSVGEAKKGRSLDSARATLAVREVSERRGVFRGRKAAKEGKVERVRHPLSPRTVSRIGRGKIALCLLSTAVVGAVAYGFGEPPLVFEHISVLASLVVFFLGAVLLARGSKSFRRYRAVRETPTTDTADASPGEKVEIYGKATVSEQGTHEAPFSEDDCLVCEYEVIEKPRRDKVVESGTAGVLFYVEDDTGKVLVDPDGVEMYTPLDTRVEVESKRPPDEITRGYVDIGVNEVKTEYRERYIKPGENVYVYGDAVDSDENGVVVRRQSKDSVFLITDSSEGELRNSLLSRAVSYAAIGVVLVSVGMGIVLSVSGMSVI